MVALCALHVRTAFAQLAPIEAGQGIMTERRSLRLEVLINGVPTHLVEPFVLTPPDRLAATRRDLRDMGVRMTAGGDAHEVVALDAIAGLSYRFDEPGQRVDIALGDGQREARIYDAGARTSRLAPQADWGALVNYTLFGTTTDTLGSFPHFSGFNATLDARAFSPVGEIGQTAIVGDTVASARKYLRLDTSYSYSSPERSTTGRLGDTISGSLVWTRAIRYGGLQMQRDFALRGDLVTRPLPNFSGSAALPSTVDVFVNSVKMVSQDVAPGPYSITNIPVVSGNGTAHVVVSDATGRQTETALPFFASPALLAPGLSDFSLDAGFARRFYGILSNDYDGRPLASAIGRYGLTDWLTLEGHGEGGAGLINAGAGALTQVGAWGTIEAALSASHRGRADGLQAFIDYSVQIGVFTLDASVQRAFRTFEDLAAVTAMSSPQASVAQALAAGSLSFDVRPPRSLDRLSVGVPLPFDLGSASATVIDLVADDRTRSRIVSLSLSRPLPYDAAFFATAYVDVAQRNSAGFYAGLSFPLGGRVRAAVGAAAGQGGTGSDLDVSQIAAHENGSFGWRLRDLEGRTPLRSAEGNYRSAYGTSDVEIVQQARTISSQAQFDGSFGWLRGPFFGNHVEDGFALVDTGVPNVPVYQDNRPIGETNVFGKLVVPDLRAYQANQIGIDPLKLPAHAEASATRQIVAPAGRSGVRLDFGVETDVRSALVTFNDAAGKPLPAGSQGQVLGRDETFVVGYDGQAYIRHLDAANSVSIETGDTSCHATFAYRGGNARQLAIGPLACL